MKKILLGLFVLSSLSFATTSTDDGKIVTAKVPINVQAIVTGNNSLVLEITDSKGIVKNSLDFMHTLKPSDGSEYTETFKVRLRDKEGTTAVFLNPTTNLAFTKVEPLEIAESKQNSIKISTTFSSVSHDGTNFALTNFIAKPAVEANNYTPGSYTGSKTDGLTITFNKTNIGDENTSPTPLAK